jgi:hypothetical protein
MLPKEACLAAVPCLVNLLGECTVGRAVGPGGREGEVVQRLGAVVLVWRGVWRGQGTGGSHR